MTRSATARSSPGGLGTAASSRKSSSTSDTEAQDSQPLLAFVDVPCTSSWQLLVKTAAPAKPARPPDGAASVASARELYPIAPALARAPERRLDELTEKRCRPRRPRLELGVELRGHEPRVVRQLDDLDEAALLEGAADDQAGVDEPLAVGVVDLVAVAVTLCDHRLAAVDLARPAAVDELH